MLSMRGGVVISSFKKSGFPGYYFMYKCTNLSNLLEFMSDWNKYLWSNQRSTSNHFFIAKNDTSVRPFPFFGGNSFKGRLISESFSLWLKSPKIGAKSLSWALYTTEKNEDA